MLNVLLRRAACFFSGEVDARWRGSARSGGCTNGQAEAGKLGTRRRREQATVAGELGTRRPVSLARAGSGGALARSSSNGGAARGGAGEARRRDRKGRRRCGRRPALGGAWRRGHGRESTVGREGEGLGFGCIDPTVGDSCTNLKYWKVGEKKIYRKIYIGLVAGEGEDS